MKLQLKRSNVIASGAAKIPTAAQLEYGELAINYNQQDPAIFLKDSNNNVIRIGGIGNIADDGQVELPTTTNPPTSPTPLNGNLWYNSQDGRLYVYYVDANSSQWVDASPDSWQSTVVPDITDPAYQSGTLDDRYINISGDTLTGALLLDNAATVATPDLAFDGDLNTGIFSPGADSLAITTAGTQRVTVNSSGNVGIGTTSPSSKLHVADGGGIFIQDTGGTERTTQVLQSGNSLFVDLRNDASNGQLVIRGKGGGSASEYMRIDSSGKMLIGTSNSVTGLTGFFGTQHAFIQLLGNASNSSGAGGLVLGRKENTGAFGANTILGQLGFTDAQAGTYAVIQGWSDGTAGTNDYPGRLVFSTTADGSSIPTERMRITSSGNVGIGTSSPSAVLDLSDAANTVNFLNFQSSYPSPSGNKSITWSDQSDVVARISVDYSPPLTKLRIGSLYNSGYQTGDVMVLDGEGKVGIGTSSPDQKLQVEGSGSQYIAITSTNSDNTGVLFGDSDIDSGYVLYTNSDNSLRFGANATERMRIKNNGYISAGTVFPTANQHRFNGVNASQGTHIFTISAYQGSGGTTQDSVLVYGCNAGGVNTALSVMKVQNISSTGRSIATAGTVNTSGTDYAEYMTKAGNFSIAKGDICGVNVNGKLTNVFADATAFVVKSTRPSYVGGDTWHEAVGAEPGGYDDNRTEEEITAAKVVYQEELETARQSVDRIAFSGQVPVNVTSANAGQYIIPVETTDGGITGKAKNEADLTLAEYMQAVGKVIALEDDGRAKIIVKVA